MQSSLPLVWPLGLTMCWGWAARENPLLEAAAYRRLLLRLLALPIIALGLLTLTLAYALQQVQVSARRVDHADQVTAKRQ